MSIILTKPRTSVRKSGALNYGDQDDAPIGLNPRGEVLVTQGLPPLTEISRLGCGWQVMDTTATAAVVVRPSTVAGLTLFNGESLGGKSYVIDSLMAFNLVSTDAIAAWGIWACVHPKMTAPTADITAIKSMSGVGNYGGRAIVDTGATVVDDGWFPAGNVSTIGNPGGVTPGMSVSIPIDGKLIVPPGGGISINIVASLDTWTFTHGFRWYEIQL